MLSEHEVSAEEASVEDEVRSQMLNEGLEDEVPTKNVDGNLDIAQSPIIVSDRKISDVEVNETAELLGASVKHEETETSTTLSSDDDSNDMIITSLPASSAPNRNGRSLLSGELNFMNLQLEIGNELFEVPFKVVRSSAFQHSKLHALLGKATKDPNSEKKKDKTYRVYQKSDGKFVIPRHLVGKNKLLTFRLLIEHISGRDPLSYVPLELSTMLYRAIYEELTFWGFPTSQFYPPSSRLFTFSCVCDLSCFSSMSAIESLCLLPRVVAIQRLEGEPPTPVHLMSPILLTGNGAAAVVMAPESSIIEEIDSLSTNHERTSEISIEDQKCNKTITRKKVSAVSALLRAHHVDNINTDSIVGAYTSHGYTLILCANEAVYPLIHHSTTTVSQSKTGGSPSLAPQVVLIPSFGRTSSTSTSPPGVIKSGSRKFTTSSSSPITGGRTASQLANLIVTSTFVETLAVKMRQCRLNSDFRSISLSDLMSESMLDIAVAQSSNVPEATSAPLVRSIYILQPNDSSNNSRKTLVYELPSDVNLQAPTLPGLSFPYLFKNGDRLQIWISSQFGLEITEVRETLYFESLPVRSTLTQATTQWTVVAAPRTDLPSNSLMGIIGGGGGASHAPLKSTATSGAGDKASTMSAGRLMGNWLESGTGSNLGSSSGGGIFGSGALLLSDPKRRRWSAVFPGGDASCNTSNLETRYTTATKWLREFSPDARDIKRIRFYPMGSLFIKQSIECHQYSNVPYAIFSVEEGDMRKIYSERLYFYIKNLPSWITSDDVDIAVSADMQTVYLYCGGTLVSREIKPTQSKYEFECVSSNSFAGAASGGSVSSANSSSAGHIRFKSPVKSRISEGGPLGSVRFGSLHCLGVLAEYDTSTSLYYQACVSEPLCEVFQKLRSLSDIGEFGTAAI